MGLPFIPYEPFRKVPGPTISAQTGEEDVEEENDDEESSINNFGSRILTILAKIIKKMLKTLATSALISGVSG